MKAVESFLVQLAEAWKPAEHKVLSIIGSTALMLQTDYERATRDTDVLQIEIDDPSKRRLLELGGPGTKLAKQWGIYVDVVFGGLPFLPQTPHWNHWNGCALRGLPTTVSVRALAVVDVVVSKLKRFNANDVSDIDAMVERALAPHDKVLTRFEAAVDYWSCDARAEDLPAYVENLHAVERDLYVVPPSDIDLPNWIG